MDLHRRGDRHLSHRRVERGQRRAPQHRLGRRIQPGRAGPVHHRYVCDMARRLHGKSHRHGALLIAAARLLWIDLVGGEPGGQRPLPGRADPGWRRFCRRGGGRLGRRAWRRRKRRGRSRFDDLRRRHGRGPLGQRTRSRHWRRPGRRQWQRLCHHLRRRWLWCGRRLWCSRRGLLCRGRRRLHCRGQWGLRLGRWWRRLWLGRWLRLRLGRWLRLGGHRRRRGRCRSSGLLEHHFDWRRLRWRRRHHDLNNTQQQSHGGGVQQRGARQRTIGPSRPALHRGQARPRHAERDTLLFWPIELPRGSDGHAGREPRLARPVDLPRGSDRPTGRDRRFTRPIGLPCGS